MSEKLKLMLARLQKEGIFIDEKEPRARFRFSDMNNFSSDDGTPRTFDAIDEDDNFLYVTYRALTKTFVPWRGLLLDFTQGDVLKSSIKLLQGQTVYTNHDTRVENWVGAIAMTKWDESSDIPPGINARYKLNKKWENVEKTDIIHGVRLGTIHSTSVDVLFDYRKSHPDMESYDFFLHQGDEINGEIVRLIATKIIGYGEASLVWQGADGFAKQRPSGLSNDGGMGLTLDKNQPKK